MVPDHVDEPLTPVVIVEQRRIKTAAVHVGSRGPLAVDGGTGHKVIVRVFVVAIQPLDVRVNQPKLPIGVGQARRPNTAAVGIAAHIQLIRPFQRTTDQRPVHQIPAVMDQHARIPLKC